MYRAYSHLLRYFQGENERQEMIPMSVPIAHNITIKREKKMGITFDRRRPPKMDITIKFYLPFTYQDGPGTPPHPNADEVHVDRFPEWTAHVREFEGFPTHRAFKRHYKDLVERLDDEGEDFATSWALFSVYNEPKEPEEERHNEVLLPAWSEKKKQSAKVKLVKSWKTWKAWTS